MKKFKILLFIFVVIISAKSGYAQVCSPAADASRWYDPEWLYRKKITIDCNMVGTAQQDNIPVLIHISGDTDLAASAQPDFDDVVFTDDVGDTQLNYEIEKYDSTTGDLWAWVKIPTLLSGTDTAIYMYYANSSFTITPAERRTLIEGTWDNGYVLVQHMSGASATDLLDSTSNHNDVASSQGAPSYDQTGADAQIANSVYFDGRTNQSLLTIADSSSLDLTNNLTIEYWVKTDGTGMPYPCSGCQRWKAIAWKNGAYFTTYQVTDKTLFSYGYTAFGNVTSDNGSSPDDTWTRYVSTYSSVSGTTAYVDDTTLGTDVANGSIVTNVAPLEIGGHAGQDRYFQGYIDELRISNVVRSEGWVKTQYNNEHTPDAYLSFGTQENLSNINVSGTSDIEGATVAIAVNGVLQVGMTATVVSGAWSILGIDKPLDGDVITVWVVGGHTTGKATAVTKYDGVGYITGMVLNEHKLTIGSTDNTNVTIDDLGLYDGDDDPDIMHTSNGSPSALTVDFENLYPGVSALDMIMDLQETDLVIANGNKFNTNGYDLDISGSLTLIGELDTTDDIAGDGTLMSVSGAGNWDMTSGTFTNTDSEVTFIGTTTVTSDSNSFNIVNIGNASMGATVTTADNMIISGDLTVANGGDTYLDISDDTVTLGGAVDLSNLEGLTATNSTVTFNGTSAQTVTSGIGRTYNNMSVSSATADVTFVDGFTADGNFTCATGGASLKFTVGETFAVGGDFILTGSSGSLITVDTDTGNSEFYLNVTGSGSASYVDVSNSNASGGSEIDASDGTNIDGGNNTNWDFTGSGGSCAADSTLPSGWYNANFLHRKRLNINCAMTRESDQTNFPVLVYLDSDAELAAGALASADDIVFTASDGVTRLDHEIEKFDNSTGELWAWVRIPTLANLTDTGLYIYYDYATSPNQENVNGTWNEGGSNNFTAVWHMAEDPSVTTDGICAGGTDEECDSTVNSNNADMQGAMAFGDKVDGKVGYAINFDGNNDYFDVLNSASLDFGSGDFTTEAWVYKNDDNDYRMVLNSRQDAANQWLFGIDNANKVTWSQDIGGTTNNLSSSGSVLSTDGWTHIVGVTERGVGTKIYINGRLDNSGADALVGDLNLAKDVRIGQDNLGSDAWSSSYFNGEMDELRIVKGVARSEGWIKTEYNNENTPSTYISKGNEENAPILEGQDNAVFFGTNF